jgi:hypothetical protein
LVTYMLCCSSCADTASWSANCWKFPPFKPFLCQHVPSVGILSAPCNQETFRGNCSQHLKFLNQFLWNNHNCNNLYYLNTGAFRVK